MSVGFGRASDPGRIARFVRRITRRILLRAVRWLGLPGEEYLIGKYVAYRGSTVFPARNLHLLSVDDGVSLHGAFFNAWAQIVIEPDVVLGHKVNFLTGTHGRKLAMTDPQADSAGPIRVERGAWVASGATILGGVTIGTGARVGAGAVVTRSIPAGQFWAGVPARPVVTDT